MTVPEKIRNHDGSRMVGIGDTVFSPAGSSDPAGGQIFAIYPYAFSPIGKMENGTITPNEHPEFLVVIQNSAGFFGALNTNCE